MSRFQTREIAMTRTALMMAMAVLVSAGVPRASQETIAAPPTSAVQGGTVLKAKTMTAVGAVKAVAADSLAIDDGPGKDWTFVIDATTKIIARPRPETINVAPASPIEGGKTIPGKPGQETVDVAPASPVEGGKAIPAKPAAITDIKEGQRVQVKYRNVNGKMHATQVRVM
jgi:hypothetical protein